MFLSFDKIIRAIYVCCPRDGLSYLFAEVIPLRIHINLKKTLLYEWILRPDMVMMSQINSISGVSHTSIDNLNICIIN